MHSVLSHSSFLPSLSFPGCFIATLSVSLSYTEGLVILVFKFHHVLNVVCFLLGNSLVSEFCMPTFQNTLSVPSSQAGRYEEHTRLWRWDRQSVPQHWHTKFTHREITQKKAYNTYTHASMYMKNIHDHSSLLEGEYQWASCHMHSTEAQCLDLRGQAVPEDGRTLMMMVMMTKWPYLTHWHIPKVLTSESRKQNNCWHSLFISSLKGKLANEGLHSSLSLYFCHIQAVQTYLALEAWAVHFIWVVTAVIVKVTTPPVRNTLIVGTTELWFRTLPIGTMTQGILLITVVPTVILKITQPSPVEQQFQILYNLNKSARTTQTLD